MTQEVDSAALTLADRAYGLSGVDAQQTTVIDDGNLAQVREMNPIARRSRVGFRSGQYTIFLRNVHAIAGELESEFNPLVPVHPINGFPSPVNTDLFDVYLMGCVSNADAGDGAAVTFGLVSINWPAAAQGDSDTAAGTAVAPAARDWPMWAWDDYTGVAAANGDIGKTSAGVSYQPFNQRMDGGQIVTFRSEVTAASAVNCLFTMGIFPIALGQDIHV